MTTTSKLSMVCSPAGGSAARCGNPASVRPGEPESAADQTSSSSRAGSSTASFTQTRNCNRLPPVDDAVVVGQGDVHSSGARRPRRSRPPGAPRSCACRGCRSAEGSGLGVESSDPNTPPLEMVNVPPLISSRVRVPSRAFVPNSAIFASIAANDMASTFRRIGTTSPARRARPRPRCHSSRSRRCRPSSMRALTAGKRSSACTAALAKNDMKPRRTPCRRSKPALCRARRASHRLHVDLVEGGQDRGGVLRLHPGAPRSAGAASTSARGVRPRERGAGSAGAGAGADVPGFGADAGAGTGPAGSAGAPVAG